MINVKAKKTFNATVYITCMGAGVYYGFQYYPGTYIRKVNVSYTKDTIYYMAIGTNPVFGCGASIAIAAQ